MRGRLFCYPQVENFGLVSYLFGRALARSGAKAGRRRLKRRGAEGASAQAALKFAARYEFGGKVAVPDRRQVKSVGIVVFDYYAVLALL
jgi:hypothetical protein